MRILQIGLVTALALLYASGCATEIELQRPDAARGWDSSVLTAFDDAHARLQQTSDPQLRAAHALDLAGVYLDIDAYTEAEHYTRIADAALDELEEPAYADLVQLVAMYFRLNDDNAAESLLQRVLDVLTLSGNEPLQGRYLAEIMRLLFVMDRTGTDQLRRVTDRALFIGDPRIRADVLQETILLMWRNNYRGEVTGLVQHAIAATAGIEDRISQAAGFLFLAGVIEQMDRQIPGVNPSQLQSRGMRIWREADLWSIERETAALAVRGSILGADADASDTEDTDTEDESGVLGELLGGIPGGNARTGILIDQAFWFLERQLTGEAAISLDLAERYAEDVDADDLKAGFWARIALGRWRLGEQDAAGELIDRARRLAPRYWHTNPDAAYATVRILAEQGTTENIATIVGEQRDPEDHLAVYLRVYRHAGTEAIRGIESLVLREVPFLLRRVSWSRSNLLPELVRPALQRAAERADTAFIAELMAIRPPEEMDVYVYARYAQALLARRSF